MPARLSLSRADITLPDGQLEQVTVVTRGATLRIFDRRTGRLTLELPGVVAVENIRRNREWTIRFDNDTIATVTRAKSGCGCS